LKTKLIIADLYKILNLGSFYFIKFNCDQQTTNYG